MKKELLQEMVNADMSVSEIAKKVGITKTPVRYWLKKHGLKTACQSGQTNKRWTDDDMKNALASSVTIADALRVLGLTLSNGNYLTVRRFIRKESIDVSHMMGKAHGSRNTCKIPLNAILVEDSTYDRGHLKRRLIDGRVLVEECALCRQGAEWNGEHLVMVLDHINGVSDDNRIDNLRLLCPNCNSQQPTFSRGASR